MNQANKVIKYLAITFGLVLAFNIILTIVFGIGSIGNIFNDNESVETRQLEINQNISNLEIDVNTSNIIIKESDVFKVETNNKYINHKQEGSKLIINEKKHSIFKNNNTKLIIYVPKHVLFENINIENGAGKVDIEKLTAKNLTLDMGAGKVSIDYIDIKDKANIDGGAGEIKISSGSINNLDMDMGVGKVDLNALITGNSKIDAGVGELKLFLIGKQDDYTITVDKGIGSIKLSGSEVTSGQTYGNGEYNIDINGGIGSIKINFSAINDDEDDIVKKYTRTYNLLNIVQGQEEYSYYLTLQIFQGEVDTVLVKNVTKELEVGKNYEFTFERIYLGNIDDNIDSIFNNSKIISISETTKTGLEQIQDNIN